MPRPPPTNLHRGLIEACSGYGCAGRRATTWPVAYSKSVRHPLPGNSPAERAITYRPYSTGAGSPPAHLGASPLIGCRNAVPRCVGLAWARRVAFAEFAGASNRVKSAGASLRLLIWRGTSWDCYPGLWAVRWSISRVSGCCNGFGAAARARRRARAGLLRRHDFRVTRGHFDKLLWAG